MEDLSPSQLRRREQVEAAIALAAPALELVLAAGEKLSRLAEPKDYEYYPVRQSEDGLREQSQPVDPTASAKD